VAAIRTYTAVCEPSGRWWAIRIPEVDGVFSQARRLDRVEYMARDAIALMLEVPPGSFRVVVRPELGPKLDEAVDRARKARSRADRAGRDAAEAATTAVAGLLGLGLTMREAGQLLGLSHQRVAQLAAAARKRAGDAPHEAAAAPDRRRHARRVAEG
jgi:hypothetical protein